MAEYPVTLFHRFMGSPGTLTGGSGWHSDNNAATYVTLPPNGDFYFNLDDTPELVAAKMDVTGWYIEFDVVSGSGDLEWTLNFDALALGGGYFAFYSDDGNGSTRVTVAPGTTRYELPLVPSYVGTTLPYQGLHTIIENIAYAWYNVNEARSYGNVTAHWQNASNIVVSEWRLVFYTPSGGWTLQVTEAMEV